MAAKLAVGDYYESGSGLGFTIVALEGKEITVEVERNVRSKDGTRSLEVRTRVITMRDWPFFVGCYTKQKAKK